MVATMKKASKEYECQDLSAIEWDKIKAVTKRPIPAIAQKMVRDVVKQTPGKYKAPYAKLGLVNGDLVLRLKDGSKHISDLVLVAAEGVGQGGQQAPQLSPQEQREINAYRQAKENLPGQTKAQLQAMELELKKVEKAVGDLQDRAAAAIRMSVPEHQTQEFQRILRDQQTADQTLLGMRALLLNTKTQMMDPHRNGQFASAPAAATGNLRKELLNMAGGCWTKANANYAKMEGAIKRAESLCRIAGTTVQATRDKLQGLSTTAQAALQTLRDAANELQNQYDEIYNGFGGSNNSAQNLLKFVQNKTEGAVKATTLDVKHGYLDQVVNQLKLVSGRSNEVYRGLDQIRKGAAELVSGVDKGLRNDQQVKPILIRLAKLAKDCDAARKEWDKDLAIGLKAFEKMKALVGTDKSAAKKVAKDTTQRVEKRTKTEQENMRRENEARKKNQK